jgi:uncharacterized membrane protein
MSLLVLIWLLSGFAGSALLIFGCAKYDGYVTVKNIVLSLLYIITGVAGLIYSMYLIAKEEKFLEYRIWERK